MQYIEGMAIGAAALLAAILSAAHNSAFPQILIIATCLGMAADALILAYMRSKR